MKICLIFPRMKYKSGDPPLGIASIASFLKKKNMEVKVLDTTFNRSFAYINFFFMNYKPDFVGIYIDTLMYNDALKIIQILKKYNLFVIAGGPHTTIMPEKVIGHVDVIVIGEGEKTIYEVIKNKDNLSKVKGIWYKDSDNNIIQTKLSKPIKNLDNLIIPDRGFFDIEKYIKNWHYLDCVNTNLRGTTFIASRGCSYNCSFCQPTLNKIFGKGVRKRSPKNIIDEIINTKKKYRLNAFFLHDDTLTNDKVWLHKFCKLLVKKDVNMIWGCNARIDQLDKKTLSLLYKSKLRVVHVGIESASQKILDKIYNKGLKIKDVKNTIKLANKIGIKILCFFMIGAPKERRKDINRTIKFATQLKCNEASFSITNPLPCTHLYYMVKKKYALSNNYLDYNYYSGRAFHDPDLPNNILKYYQMKAILYFYLHPYRWPYIIKHLISIKGLYKMIIKIKRFL